MPEINANGKKSKPDSFGSSTLLIIVIAIISIIFFISYLNQANGSKKDITYSFFLDSIENKLITEITIIDDRNIEGFYVDSSGLKTEFKTNIPYFDSNLLSYLREKGIKINGKVSDTTILQILFQILPWIIFGFIFIFFLKQMQGNGNKAMSFGKSRAHLYDERGKKLSFNDVAGQIEAKEELKEVVDFLKNPQKFVKMGAKIPKGVLLVGLPGTGKTMLARAVAGEAGVSFFHMSGSDFVEMFVGVGASRVRDLFEQGRANTPCIIFIDELDAVGRTRGAGVGGGHDEREQTLNQLLVEMDGFDAREGIIVLAATNRADVLDAALLRPGRFDRQVVVALPDIREREAILTIHAKKVPISDDVELPRIARATPGTSGADLANLVNEAALFAARKGKDCVDMRDFEDARDKVLMGTARASLVVTEDEKRATAWHEAGHALLHYYLENADPLHKVTIMPRGQALGIAMSLPERDTYSKKRSWLFDRIVIAYGGYAAEKLIYGETTTGTKADIDYATNLARRMVCEWGMSNEMGPVNYSHEDEPIFFAKEFSHKQTLSENTAMKIDTAVNMILTEALDKAIMILTREKQNLTLLTEELINKETLVDYDIKKLLNMLPSKTQ